MVALAREGHARPGRFRIAADRGRFSGGDSALPSFGAVLTRLKTTASSVKPREFLVAPSSGLYCGHGGNTGLIPCGDFGPSSARLRELGRTTGHRRWTGCLPSSRSSLLHRGRERCAMRLPPRRLSRPCGHLVDQLAPSWKFDVGRRGRGDQEKTAMTRRRDSWRQPGTACASAGGDSWAWCPLGGLFELPSAHS